MSVTKVRVTALFAAMLSLAILPACDDDPAGPDTGSVDVSVTTSGDGTDDDGYVVTLGDASEDVEVDDAVTFEDVAVGSREVELSDLADGCEVDGDNPVEVTVESDETASADFEVTCQAA